MSVSGREAILDVREWSGNPLECPGCPPGYPGVVGSPSQMSGSCQDTLPEVPEWWEALLNVWEWSKG